MPVRSCVTILDMDGVSHALEVTAATLYEAVAPGLAPIRGNDWVARIARDHDVIKVSVADVQRDSWVWWVRARYTVPVGLRPAGLAITSVEKPCGGYLARIP